MKGDDLLKLLVIIFLILIPALRQLFVKWRQEQQKRAGGGQQPQRPAGVGQQPQRPAPGPLGDEIGDFLRRAAEGRGGNRPSARPPQAQPPRSKPPSPPPLARPQQPQTPVQAQTVAAAPVGGRVAEHVQKYLDTGEFKRRASGLAEEMTRADQEMEKHFRGVFDHDLGRLSGRSAEAAAEAATPEPRTPEVPPTGAAGLAALLSQVENVRQAIVINEILQRPEHRWS